MNHTTFAASVDHVAHQSQSEQGRRLSVADIAERIGRPENYLRKAVSQHDDAHPLRGDLIVPLTLATRNYAIVHHIAHQVGGVFFPLPEVLSDGQMDVVQQTGKAVGEFGDVLMDLRVTLADGRITAEEVASVKRQADEAIAEIMRLVHLLESKVVPVPTTPSLRMAGGSR